MRFQGLRWIGATTIVVGLGRMAGAQSTNVTCPSSMDWAKNSLGQNPCLMGAYAYEPCDGSIEVATLPDGNVYAGPFSSNDSVACLCNTVTYYLFAACGACQNHSAQAWNAWSNFCNSSGPYIQVYPAGVPAGTAFPPWAYLPIVSNSWDQDLAVQNASAVAAAASQSAAISSSSVAAVSATSVAASLSNAAIASSLSALQASSTGGSSHHSNAGAIAGGVVGGIAGIGLVIGAVIFFLRRSSKKAQNEYADPRHSQPDMYQPSVNPSNNPRETKFYNPDDPTTYPQSPNSASATLPTQGYQPPYQQQAWGHPQQSGYDQASSHGPGQPTGYNGAPEVY
ncbi:hypothetical protein CONPUDRAFT_134612 [Coniophora puteana RWD-64-598 SS2]|uniref:Transmembrane protein n=1 Tax=Coniophora puteana (strain RWD-64-598) TaxID=741705 RepID=A0A5M3N068_CONPW|nr:uncharacterized protein CONPUDRAFT_134612 [Coniophora puteana RWD-64-598 SS2]EIW84647.1 hypothetical protein CONPUDRAFT_134612 [Coniophora puteana RWD-64-598 SS2]